MTNIPASHQRLKFENSPLENDQFISDSRIENDGKVIMFLENRGGMMGEQVNSAGYVEFDNLSTKD